MLAIKETSHFGRGTTLLQVLRNSAPNCFNPGCLYAEEGEVAQNKQAQ
jgi:hypothetical protein